ncbi:MAG: hypothetical protein HYW22_01700 [Candidatus Aenigmarchaeota archaeon]|nr:hypothetical protein [Candidatus Aenigmarchaeota archaeon]
MKLSKKILLITSLSISLLGLILIYAASLNVHPQKISITDITSDMEGRKIITTGYIVEKRDNPDGICSLQSLMGKRKFKFRYFQI